MRPPRPASTAASIRNCHRMSLRRAPTDLRIPISWVRSVTVASMMFMVVGGIVIMNIMLATVTERTHEIGIRKSVGARRSDILWQFLIEAAVLAGLGGLMGVLLSYAIARLV